MDKELLQRYVEGSVSDEEMETVVAWLDADEANVTEFMALHKLYDISVWNRPVRQAQKPTERKMLVPVVRKWSIELLKIAAVFLAVYWGLQHLETHQVKKEEPVVWQTLCVPAGQRAELTLADGSHLWLNARSRLLYPSNFEKGKREVRLEGEAYFTVQPDEKRPFIVKTPPMDVRVLGTEFNVMAYGNDSTIFEIALLKGTVELLSGTQPAYRMNVNEMAAWKNGQFQSALIRDYDYFRWQEGLICVYNETVGDILKKLERYFDVRIIVKRTDLVNYHYSGKFRTSDGVEQVLRVLQLEHEFKYERDHEQNIITIK